MALLLRMMCLLRGLMLPSWSDRVLVNARNGQVLGSPQMLGKLAGCISRLIGGQPIIPMLKLLVVPGCSCRSVWMHCPVLIDPIDCTILHGLPSRILLVIVRSRRRGKTHDRGANSRQLRLLKPSHVLCM